MSSITMNVNNKLHMELSKLVKTVASEYVEECGKRYGFDAKEALALLELSVEKKGKQAKVAEKKAKPAFPLPYNGECVEEDCHALRQNSGMFTQCQNVRKEGLFCCKCESWMRKHDKDMPEFGTIEGRKSIGIYEYVDPKGRKPFGSTYS